ncbi:hypothetical protein AB205_0163320, partial [Aquarana catesbeiana]
MPTVWMKGHSSIFWLRVPLMTPDDLREDLIDNEPLPQSEGEDNDGEERTWLWWHHFRTLCDYNKRIALAIEMGADLPSSSIIDRWLGEPIKAAILPTCIFLTNKKGFPVLSKVHQRLIFRLFKLEVQFVISGSHHHSEKDFCSYLQYLEYLSQNRPPPNAYEMFAKGYEDYLQSPLQPLMDNLESQTYEVFEKDPVKYSQYQQVQLHVTLDILFGLSSAPVRHDARREQSLAQRGFGGGHSPQTLRVTSQDPGDKAQFEMPYVVRLHNFHQLAEPLQCFTFKHPNTDFLVLTEGGVSIPGEYTSYLAPISSSKLYNEVRACREKDRDPEVSQTNAVIDNNRYRCLRYSVKLNTVLHGFAGYFQTVLYKDVTLSICPETHSPGMFSWFPILFPIK